MPVPNLAPRWGKGTFSVCPNHECQKGVRPRSSPDEKQEGNGWRHRQAIKGKLRTGQEDVKV